MKKALAGAVVAGMGAMLLASTAMADAVTITYYTINSSDPDADHLAGGVFTNEVQNTLGPNGLPILNIPLYGCTSNCYSVNGAPGFPNGGNTPNTNVDASTGEITYWDPTLNPYVSETLQSSTTLPFSEPSNFFPPNGTGSGDGGANGYQAAVLSGTLDAGSTEQLSFNIGSDDMAFAYIDGNLVCDDGGVHGSASVTCTTPTITQGDHSLEVFFVDINQVQSGLTFGINTQDVTVTVPAPGALALLGFGLAGLGGLRRRKAA